MTSALRKTIEAVVDATNDDGLLDRFSMGKLSGKALALLALDPVIEPSMADLHETFGGTGKHFLKLEEAIIRSAFLIELVKLPKVETTKFRYRWFDQLVDDPRWATFDECLKVARDLFTSAVEWYKSDASHEELMKTAFDSSLYKYEAPIDYEKRSTASAERIHRSGNVSWFSGPATLSTLRLRSFLRNKATSPDALVFAKVYKKLKTKTYLTDRAQTGEFKTNREKRWETHPQSVHFALRRECLEIEHALVTEIFRFKNFPSSAAEVLRVAKLFPADDSVALCPITGEPLDYVKFRDEILAPKQGQSTFQVGHLNPLKFESLADSHSGHTAGNIGWISDEGNRIQGNRAGVIETREFIKTIVNNYRDLNW